jgi:hypothetical protein
MIQNIEWYSAFPLVTGVMALLLGLAVLRRDRQLAITNGFFILMLEFTGAGFVDFMMINASDIGSALLSARILILLLILIFASFLYLSAYLVLASFSRWLERNWVLYFLMSVTIGLVLAYNLDSLVYNRFGYGLPASFGSLVVLSVLSVFTAVTLSLLVQRRYRSDDEQVRGECLLLSLGVVAPYVWGLLLFVMDLHSFNIPSELSPGFFVSIVIIALSIVRHRLFRVVPVSEDRTGMIGAQGGEPLPAGSNYLFEEARADGMYEALLSQISSGLEGLIVTRTYPDDLREKYGLKRTPVIWLTSQPGQDRVDPTNLSILERTIVDFIKMGHDTVIAIDGTEYLISNNSSPKVLRLLYGLRDEILMSRSRMIVTIDPKVLDDRELAFFERDFEIIRI